MPVVIITIVMPIAMMAITTIRSAIAIKFDFLRKSGYMYGFGCSIFVVKFSRNFHAEASFETTSTSTECCVFSCSNALRTSGGWPFTASTALTCACCNCVMTSAL